MHDSCWRLVAALIGISLLAGCVQQEAPVAATPQPAPMVAAPQTSTYQVYFNTNRSQLNADDEATIKSIAAAVQGNSTASVAIVGKADTVGKANANMKLSQQRADQVRDALIAAGVPASSINSSWTGEGQLPVPTADNVAEVHNRVVEITVQTPRPAMAAASQDQDYDWGPSTVPGHFEPTPGH